MSIPTASAPTQSASHSTSPRPTISSASASDFSSTTRVRDTGFARSVSSVPRSSSPAIVPAPVAMAATRKRSGTMSEKSSIPRYPAAEA